MTQTQVVTKEMLAALALSAPSREGYAGSQEYGGAAEDRIPSGRRNTTLTSLAGSMRRRGFGEESIAAALLVHNRERCDPPLGEAEVRTIAHSIIRYQPGPSASLENLAAPSGAENDSAVAPLLRAAESNLPFRSARQIIEMSPESVPWVVTGYVAEGAITGVDGRPKASGKTTLVLHMCRHVLDGEEFLGLPTSATGVLYLTEQSATTFREALVRAGLRDREDFVALLWRDTLGVDWHRVVREAVQEAVRRGAKLLVVDTLPQFSGLQGDAENSAGAALAAVQPLQEAAAAHDLAIIVVRHERKSGGNVGDSGRGSSAFAGAVDVIVSIRRPEGNSRPEIRELHALSRFDVTPDLLIMELTEEGYRSLGTRDDVAAAEAREAILDALPADEVGAMTLDELVRAAPVARTTVQQVIGNMLVTGELGSRGQGVRGDPRRYWRSDDEGEGTETGG